MGGAEAVGLKDVIGSITRGKRADLLITRGDSTKLTPVWDPVASLVLNANGSDIDTVFIHGKLTKHEGKLVDIDWAKVRAELRELAKNIRDCFDKASRQAIAQKVHEVMTAFTGAGFE
ncbi:hypothetical protein LTR93_011642 [Exophiala xenobiotica]|nr:hypothetical protein LTR93_011642 [Exophiala xenobiotica]